MRASRTIRDRIAAKANPAPKLRAAESIEITEHGVTLDGHTLPHFLGTEFTIDHYGPDFHLVTFGVYTDAVSVPELLPARTSLTERFH